MARALKVIQNVEAPQPVEIIVDAIVAIAKAMKKINGTRLKRSAIVTLIQYESKLPRRDIELVLNNLEQLETIWLKAPVIEDKQSA